MRPKKLLRLIIRMLLFLAVLIASIIGIKAYQLQEWETIASVLAVTTGILAIATSLNVTWNQEDQNDPNISFFIAKGSHKYAFEIVMQNDGGAPAYNVRIHWIKPIKDFRDVEARFSEYEERPDFEFLPQGAKYGRYLIGADNFKRLVEKADGPLDYECEVSYTTSLTSSYKLKKRFILSLEPFRYSLNVESDQADFYFENKQLGKHIKSLSESIKSIERIMRTQQQNSEDQNI